MKRRNIADKMNFKRYIPNHAVTTIPALAILVAAHFFLASEDSSETGIELANSAPVYYEHWQRQAEEFDIDGGLERLQLDDAERDRRIRGLLHQGEFQQARTQLLEVAAAAVLQEDQNRLEDTLLLLGEVAINQQELSAAEIYLQEALHLAMEQDNVLNTARCYQMLGQLNIRARELARRASNTYDSLWQARNATSRGLYHGVSDNLQAVIAENVEIRRYGAAADAYEALASLYDHLHDDYQAQQARIEAAKLFASTGQVTHVRRLLDGLDYAQITTDEFQRLERDIDTTLGLHKRDLIQTSQARDYQMLYHHYLRKGELERAWKFRIKSSETLANTGDRAMFQRQADVIAVLYNSNFAMDRAKQYLDKAGAIYNDEGAPELMEQTRDMESLIY